DAEVRRSLGAIPPDGRKLVTGHESMGYFAQRYAVRLVGAVVPSLSSQAESSAAQLSALKALIAKEQVRVLFTELGTPQRVVDALAGEAGVRCVALTTHAVPADGSYFTFMHNLADTIASNLR
ncbi:MAG TPA: metal ABC transporter substrate-binding protein, partial [Myxococcaceae bacterium]|nr:metal ABC transporter substrate-binding protein [Myxococcaceae bacterium]